MKWVEALKLWNEHHKKVNTAHTWMIPRKDTPEHAQVKEIMSRGGLPSALQTKTVKEGKTSISGEEYAALPKAEQAKVRAYMSYAAQEPAAAKSRATALEKLREVERTTKARNVSRTPAVSAEEAAVAKRSALLNKQVKFVKENFSLSNRAVAKYLFERLGIQGDGNRLLTGEIVYPLEPALRDFSKYVYSNFFGDRKNLPTIDKLEEFLKRDLPEVRLSVPDKKKGLMVPDAEGARYIDDRAWEAIAESLYK